MPPKDKRELRGVRHIAALAQSLREEFNFPIFLNPDHTHSLPRAVEAAKTGYDATVLTLPRFLGAVQQSNNFVR